MGVRILGLSLLLTLTGCSSLTGGLFGSGDSKAPSAAENRIGKITADTPFNEEGLSETLGPDYRLRAGMGMTNNELFSFFQALKETDGKEQLAQTIYGKYDTGIVRVEVLEPGVSTGEAQIGTPFSEVFAQAFGACDLEKNGSESEVICNSIKNQNIRYVFSGEWNGPEELLPANEVLKDWTVSKIIWNNAAGSSVVNSEKTEPAAEVEEDAVSEVADVTAVPETDDTDELGKLVQSLEDGAVS